MIESIGADPSALSLNALKQNAEAQKQTAALLEESVQKTEKAAAESAPATPEHRGQAVNTTA